MVDREESDTQVALSQKSEQLVSVEAARAIHEIQGAIVSAKKFPRDSQAAYKRIMDACKRKSFAEQALYSYKRGSSLVSGPSIRMAELLAQNYGNIGCGITELESREGESQMQAWCIDYETNYQKRVTFSVPHTRDTSSGKKKLTDARDIYENNFNMGARRLRNCILAVIPADFVDDAEKVVEKTLAGDGSVPLVDRARQMVSTFESLGVSKEMIERRIGHKIDSIIEHELVVLRKTFLSIQDGMTTVANEFDTGTPEGGKAGVLQERLKVKDAEKAAADKTSSKPAEKTEQAPPAEGSFGAYEGGPVNASKTTEADRRGK